MKQEREARRLKILSNDNTTNSALFRGKATETNVIAIGSWFVCINLGNVTSTNQSFPPTIADYRQSQRSFKENPRRLRADILHKNSFYYNQAAPHTEATDNFRLRTVTEHCCEWKACTAKFLSNKDLLRHLQEEHVSCLPLNISSEFQSQRQLVCQWRNCKENRCYPARYKLLLHLQRLHCNGRSTERVWLYYSHYL